MKVVFVIRFVLDQNYVVYDCFFGLCVCMCVCYWLLDVTMAGFSCIYINVILYNYIINTSMKTSMMPIFHHIILE